MDGIVQENGQQNNLPPMESNLCCSVQSPTEQTVDIPSDSNGKRDINSEKNDINTIVQLTPVNQGESHIKPTCAQSLTMPVVYPELSIPNHTNLSTLLFSGQIPTNILNTKLASLFNTPSQFIGQVKNPLTSVVPIVKGAVQSTVVASTRIPMESLTVMSGNVCSKMLIAPSSPSKVTKFCYNFFKLFDVQLVTEPRLSATRHLCITGVWNTQESKVDLWCTCTICTLLFGLAI